MRPKLATECEGAVWPNIYTGNQNTGRHRPFYKSKKNAFDLYGVVYLGLVMLIYGALVLANLPERIIGNPFSLPERMTVVESGFLLTKNRAWPVCLPPLLWVVS